MIVSCPGKLVLIGEYGVLEGGRALVGATSARASGARVETLDLGSPVVRKVRACALAAGGQYRGGVDIDTRAFRHGRSKLGIGSSAATAVCTSALVLGRCDDEAQACALEGHRAASGGRGSGIDILACHRGGVIACERQPGAVVELSTRLPGYQLSVWFLGVASSTSDLIGRCKAAPSWDSWIAIFRDLGEQGIAAWEDGNSPSFLTAVAKFSAAMAGMGQDAGVDLLTPAGAELIDAISALGGAAKPSGAGGGDVALAWTPLGTDLSALAERVSARRLDIDIGAPGLRLED